MCFIKSATDILKRCRIEVAGINWAQNGLFRQSLNGTGKNWLALYHVELSHYNLCGNLNENN